MGERGRGEKSPHSRDQGWGRGGERHSPSPSHAGAIPICELLRVSPCIGSLGGLKGGFEWIRFKAFGISAAIWVFEKQG